MGLLYALAQSLYAAPEQTKAQSAGGFRYSRSLTTAEQITSGLGRFVLDNTVLSNTRSDFGDLRVVDERDTPVPTLAREIRSAAMVHEEKTVPAHITGINPMPDGAIEITVSVQATNRAIHAIRLETTMANFEKFVSVFGSSPEGEWLPLAEDAPIFDYSRFLDARNDRVEIQPGSYNSLRIRIEAVSERKESPLTTIVREQGSSGNWNISETTTLVRKDLRIDAIRVIEKTTRETPGRRVTSNRPLKMLETRQNMTDKTTVITLQAKRSPLVAISISAHEQNFFRPVILQGRLGKDEWAQIARGTVRSVSVGQAQARELSIALPGPARFDELRLIIQNGDNPPLSILSVQGEEQKYEALFFTEPGKSYKVKYGNPRANLPHYDIAAVLGRAGSAEAVEYSLGEQDDAGEQSKEVSEMLPRAMLMVAIILCVAVLGFLLVKAARNQQ